MAKSQLTIMAIDGKTLDQLLNRIIALQRTVDRLSKRIIEVEREATEMAAEATPTVINGRVIMRAVDLEANARFYKLDGLDEIEQPPELG